ncbi:MAG TPA: phosphoribosyltransferase family protein [Niabella sp.]|nr:phosphoribosyltransferase family protein [Niabella sp.]HOZ98102.1 phosphoribosyltransferase family protein [Niabella sp.]HQW16154.1 phosphoribosyltransferase family protein [Niabella sp.]HQX21366.1 phosphoribosyltransferase family protein [Niabella sp.]HQX42242.1 phosphoribosyltransferase family protein [Niabella sp.]
MKDKKYILEQPVIEKKLNRLALEIIENNIEEKELVFVGIAPNGMVLAEKLKQIVEKFSCVKIEFLTLSLNKRKPEDVVLNKTMDFKNRVVVIIDDVINSGKTLLYALKPFLDVYPKKIQTLVLVERTHTRFPVHANYKGFTLATTLQEHIIVEVEGDEILGAFLS